MAAQHPRPGERSFGLTVGAGFLGLAGIAWWRGHLTTSSTFAAIGAVLALAGLAAPRLLVVPSRIWWRIAQALGWVNSRVLLTVVFIAVLTPIGVVRRLLGKHALRGETGATNWASARPRQPAHYDRMF
jgi:hypothetical protein